MYKGQPEIPLETPYKNSVIWRKEQRKLVKPLKRNNNYKILNVQGCSPIPVLKLLRWFQKYRIFKAFIRGDILYNVHFV